MIRSVLPLVLFACLVLASPGPDPRPFVGPTVLPRQATATSAADEGALGELPDSLVTATATLSFNPDPAVASIVSALEAEATQVITNLDSIFSYEPVEAWLFSLLFPECILSGGLQTTSTANATLKFTFVGESLSILTASDTDGGPYSIQIDNDPPQMFTSKADNETCAPPAVPTFASASAMRLARRAGEPQVPMRTAIVKNVGPGSLKFDSVQVSNSTSNSTSGNSTSGSGGSGGSGSGSGGSGSGGSAPASSGANVASFAVPWVIALVAVVHGYYVVRA